MSLQAQEEAMVMVGHADATTKMLRAELVDARAKAKRNLGAAKKIKDKAKTRLVTPTLLDPRVSASRAQD